MKNIVLIIGVLILLQNLSYADSEVSDCNIQGESGIQYDADTLGKGPQQPPPP